MYQQLILILLIQLYAVQVHSALHMGPEGGEGGGEPGGEEERCVVKFDIFIKAKEVIHACLANNSHTYIYIYIYTAQLDSSCPASYTCTRVRHPPTSESHTATNKQSDKILFLSFLFYCFLLTSTK